MLKVACFCESVGVYSDNKKYIRADALVGKQAT